ncbi:unnamed protein product [Porites evermanni]|uniref:Uncharacterized protein n=1 Tax=Porites evermanni TaxID=104178 RepID=A0ABN8R4R1_9CNID|nr:unnamed protein product [Porites evermanni]
MAAAKLIILSCLVAVFGYFTYKELQVNTLSLTKKIHIPAKRSDVFQKMFDDPEFYLKIHPLCTGVSNIVRFKDNEGRRVVQFDIHEKAVLLGFYDTGNITFQITTNASKEKNTATQTTASLMNGMLQINQEFHMSDSDGRTLLEDHASYTAPRILARIALSEAHSAHSAILENTRQQFMKLSLQHRGGFRNYS